MRARITSLLSACGVSLLFAFVPGRAEAKALDKCGGIFLSASSACEFKPIQECMTTCSTTSVEQVCAQKTFTTCNDTCTVTDTKECTKTHSESCTKECDTISTSSSHDVCTSECTDNCTADAMKKNSFNGDHGRCHTHCAHDCEARCDSCSTSDQSTSCDTKCASITENECHEEVNRDCVLTCQTDNYTSCETDTVTTCNTSCMDKGGALFCDGQFLEADDLRACADQLAVEFSFDIDVTAHVAVSGDGSVTTTNNDGSKSTKNCSFAPPTPDQHGLFLGTLAALGIVAARRYRRRA